jgi:Protein of unknown function (DUF2637)
VTTVKRQISRRHVVITGAVTVAVTAFAASADTLASLGQAVGWKGQLSWSLPVAVDVLALVALVAWFTPGVRQLGQWMTAGSVVTSVILNAVGHLVSTGHLTVGPKLVIGVSAVPVISMALAAHLAVEVTKPEEDRTVTSEDDRPVVTTDHRQDVVDVTAEVTTPAVPVVTTDDHLPVTPPAFEGDHLGAEVTTPALEAVTTDDRQEVTEVTAPVTVMAAESDRRMVTEKVTDTSAPVTEVTTTVRRKAEELTAEQGGRVTIDQLRELGLSRRTATALRRELVTEGVSA